MAVRRQNVLFECIPLQLLLLLLHLMAVSYDRYNSIVKSPLTYNGTITKCRVTLLLLIWLIPIGFSIVPFIKWGGYVYNPEVFFCQQELTAQSCTSGWRIAFALVFLVVPLLVIAFLNWSVYKTAKRQANALAIQIRSLDGSESQQQENSRRRISERKVACFGCQYYHRHVSFVLSTYLDRGPMSTVRRKH